MTSAHRKTWTAMLAKLLAPMDHVNAAKALAGMLSMPVFSSLPDAAYTIPSLEHVAAQFKRVPTYSELHAALDTWWRANAPPSAILVLEGPGSDALEEIDRRMISSWMTNRPWYVAENLLSASLHMLRAKFPRAYRYIINHDLEAAGIAVRRGWDGRSEEDARQSWQDPMAIRESVRLVLSSHVQQMHLGKMLGKAVATHALHHLHHVPPEWHPIEETAA